MKMSKLSIASIIILSLIAPNYLWTEEKPIKKVPQNNVLKKSLENILGRFYIQMQKKKDSLHGMKKEGFIKNMIEQINKLNPELLKTTKEENNNFRLGNFQNAKNVREYYILMEYFNKHKLAVPHLVKFIDGDKAKREIKDAELEIAIRLLKHQKEVFTQAVSKK